ncbi:MAG: hypothetical protein ABSC08_01285 [Bryobacteraceae bacterium]|jgi:hypothetical protein
MAFAASAAAALAFAQSDAVVVTSEPAYAETTYATAAGDCRISWIVSHTELNKGVIRHRSDCSLPFPEQMPLIARVMTRVFKDEPGIGASPKLYWGRLYPDGHPDPLLAARLATAAKRSPQWDSIHGRPVSGNVNLFVRKLANDARIYTELRKLFRKSGLEIEVAAVEKVLIGRAAELPFLQPLPQGMQAADRLPYDCMVWLSISRSVSR